MNEPHKTDPAIASVSISRLGAPVSTAEPSPPPWGMTRPVRWLGADSPFGLALPDAHPTSSTFYAPRGVWLDDQRLIVCDSGNHRVLIWNSIPAEDHAPADVVLGQPGFDSEGPAAGGRGPENGFHLPTGIIVAEGKLLVADAWHHRVLVWNTVPTDNDTPPDYALGQRDLGHVKENRGTTPTLQGMYWPYGIAYLNRKLYVADTGNRRVLIWDGIPETDRPADAMVGQESESDSEENRGGPPTANSFRWPHDFAGDDSLLLVADAGNHRVLGWRQHPTEDRAADFVLGQKQFDSAYEFPYTPPGTRSLRFPYGIDVSEGVLAVADTANNRILFWSLPIDETHYAAAVDVAGQADFETSGENRWRTVDRHSLCWPYGICFHRQTLAIADSGNNRVILWDCSDLIEQIRAGVVDTERTGDTKPATEKN